MATRLHANHDSERAHRRRAGTAGQTPRPAAEAAPSPADAAHAEVESAAARRLHQGTPRLGAAGDTAGLLIPIFHMMGPQKNDVNSNRCYWHKTQRARQSCRMEANTGAA